jgi:hypothetical protein
MGIENYFYSELIDVIDNQLQDKTNKKVLCLGYPDLLVDEDFLENLYGTDFVQTIPEDQCAADIKNWHHRPSLSKVFDICWLLKHHGFEITIFDNTKHRGYETIVDLNEPIDVSFCDQFDLIIDTGTLEHCFNVGQAFKNVCQCVKIDGIFMTCAPITSLNHGYWNFGTIVHQDGFLFNGFEILKTKNLYRNNTEIPEESMTKKSVPLMATLFTVAKKKENKSWTWPTQRKYRKKG